MSKIEVRPIDRERWHGKKGKESFSQPHTVQALVDAETLEYAVDISKEDKKFFDEKKVRYDLSTHFDPEEPHEFWDSSTPRVKLANRTMFFNKKVVIDRIKICVMKASKYVANTIEDYEQGLFPEATHYIHDETALMANKASKVAQEDEAIIAASKLPKQRKIEILKVLAGGHLKEQSDNYLTVFTKKQIKKDPELFLKMISEDKVRVSALATVHEALDKNVLRKNGHKIIFNGSNIGTDVESVAQYLMKDENQELMLLIKNKIA